MWEKKNGEKKYKIRKYNKKLIYIYIYKFNINKFFYMLF